MHNNAVINADYIIKDSFMGFYISNKPSAKLSKSP